MRRTFTVEFDNVPTDVTAEVTRCADEGGPYPEVEIIDVEGWLLGDLSDAEIDELKDRVVLHLLAE